MLKSNRSIQYLISPRDGIVARFVGGEALEICYPSELMGKQIDYGSYLLRYPDTTSVGCLSILTATEELYRARQKCATLDLFLFLLDNSLSTKTKCLIAQQLEPLLTVIENENYVLDIVLASPLSHDSAMGVDVGDFVSTSSVYRILRNVLDAQIWVKEVYDSWMAFASLLPMDFDRGRIRGLLVDLGIARNLVDSKRQRRSAENALQLIDNNDTRMTFKEGQVLRSFVVRIWKSVSGLTVPNALFMVAPNVLVGPIVSGEKVIANDQSQEAVQISSNLCDTSAIDMESYGFEHALESLSKLTDSSGTFNHPTINPASLQLDKRRLLEDSSLVLTELEPRIRSMHRNCRLKILEDTRATILNTWDEYSKRLSEYSIDALRYFAAQVFEYHEFVFIERCRTFCSILEKLITYSQWPSATDLFAMHSTVREDFVEQVLQLIEQESETTRWTIELMLRGLNQTQIAERCNISAREVGHSVGLFWKRIENEIHELSKIVQRDAELLVNHDSGLNQESLIVAKRLKLCSPDEIRLLFEKTDTAIAQLTINKEDRFYLQSTVASVKELASQISSDSTIQIARLLGYIREADPRMFGSIFEVAVREREMVLASTPAEIDVQLTTTSMIQNSSGWQSIPAEVVAKLESAETSESDLMCAVLVAENSSFAATEMIRVVKALASFIDANRLTDDDDRMIYVASAVRKYAMNMSAADFDSYASWLEPSDTTPVHHEIEMELVKALSYRLQFEPLPAGLQCPRLVQTLADIADAYLRKALILQKSFANTSMLAIVCLNILEANDEHGVTNNISALITKARLLRIQWFEEMLHDQLESAKSHIRSHSSEVASRMQSLIDLQVK